MKHIVWVEIRDWRKGQDSELGSGFKTRFRVRVQDGREIELRIRERGWGRNSRPRAGLAFGTKVGVGTRASSGLEFGVEDQSQDPVLESRSGFGTGVGFQNNDKVGFWDKVKLDLEIGDSGWNFGIEVRSGFGTTVKVWVRNRDMSLGLGV
ncbi:hypothetical protein TIFTF001_031118 [Ficus carica]|uniref:Uncharacterized protein n=1 Tax=Ficus carica TaxID=3494 RepID=A0AA88DW94_FICCA|nr:hypothetical protein TIFTF001_031118 [Ficus carica]